MGSILVCRCATDLPEPPLSGRSQGAGFGFASFPGPSFFRNVGPGTGQLVGALSLPADEATYSTQKSFALHRDLIADD